MHKYDYTIWTFYSIRSFSQTLMKKTMATFAFFFSFRFARSNESIYVLWTIYNIYTVWTIYSIRSFWQTLMKKQWRRLYFFSETSDVFLQMNLHTNVHTLNYSKLFVVVADSERLKLFLLSDIKYRLKVLYRIYNISSSA